jgi:hypothetical protein
MLSFIDAVNILNNLPEELVSITFNYLNGLDMVNFINGNKNNYISSLNINSDELNVWNLMKESENKLFEWCNILVCADIKSGYYKTKYEEFQRNPYKPYTHTTTFVLPTNKEKKYNRKLYIGLFLNAGVDIILAYKYSKLSIDKINSIFEIMKAMPETFNVQTLYSIINFDNELDTKENYINYAIKYNKILNLVKETKEYKMLDSFVKETKEYKILNLQHFMNAVMCFPDAAYERLISLLELNISFESAYTLSTPSRKFTDALIDKFKQLNEEFQIKDDFLVCHLRNNKIINSIRTLKTKNISSNCICDLINSVNKDLLEDLIKNNYIYEFGRHTWFKINSIYINHNDIYPDILTKFTIKQKNNLRMKELMEDGGYDELLLNYIKENVDKVYLFSFYNYNSTLPPVPGGAYFNYNSLITTVQYFQVYIELTDFQLNTFLSLIKQHLPFEKALSETYQIVEYEYGALNPFAKIKGTFN